MRTLKLATMLVREAISRDALRRRPEPTTLMDDVSQVEAFHQQGQEALLPVYHFNALATSRMTPVGGTVLDLGSGSGQYLAYLAERRPDLRIIGLELAPAMAAVGQRMLAQRGLAQRVELRIGDMTDFATRLTEPVDTISSVFSLHHLPTDEMLSACLSQVRVLRVRDRSAIWIFDHARPRHHLTPAVFPSIFTPEAAKAFNEDSTNSLAAAFSFAELRAALVAVLGEEGDHHLSRWMRLYQVHKYGANRYVGSERAWTGGSLSAVALKQWRGLKSLFPELSALD